MDYFHFVALLIGWLLFTTIVALFLWEVEWKVRDENPPFNLEKEKMSLEQSWNYKHWEIHKLRASWVGH